MDDYIRALLLGQFSGEEAQPEKLSGALEGQEQNKKTGSQTRKETSPEEAMAKTLDAVAPEAAGRRAGESRAETRITALEETAGKRFLRRLEREIASLETTEHTSIIFRQQETQETGEGREEVRILGQKVAGEKITPEGLSRVFQRDARRFY